MPPIDPSLTDTNLDPAGQRMDADPPPAADEPAAKADDMLALGEDDMALLKQMSPEGQAMLMGLMSGEASEAEAMAAAALAAGAAAGAPPALDAAVPPPVAAAAAAPTAPMLDAAAVAKMIADAIAAIGKKPEGEEEKPDEEEAPADKKDRGHIDAAKVIADAADASRRAYNDAAALTEAVRKDGHPVVGAESAAIVALSVITTHAPRLADAAKAALKANRMDAFLAIYDTAEDTRRDSLLDDQGAHLVGALRGDDGAALPMPFVLPAHLVRS